MIIISEIAAEHNNMTTRVHGNDDILYGNWVWFAIIIKPRGDLISDVHIY